MEILYKILAFLFGGILVYFITKSATVSRTLYDELNRKLILLNADFNNDEKKIAELQIQLKNYQKLELNLNNNLNQLQQEVSTLFANNSMQTQQLQSQKDIERELTLELKNARLQNQSLIESKSNLAANNENLISKLATYKEEVLAADKPTCRLERIRQDLSDAAGRKPLFAQLAARAKKILVLAEGLMIYLDPPEVVLRARDLHEPPTLKPGVL